MNNLKIIANKSTLVDLVEEKLLGYFKNQNLKPGDSIPTELELTVALGVGRSVLREALSRFRMLGLIQSRTRRGMILSEPDMLGGLNKVVEPNIMSIESIKDILGLRIAIEIGNSYLIIKHITDEDIFELEKIIMNYSASKYNKFTVDADHAFHSKLHEISRNKLISRYQEIFYKVFVFVNENYKKYFKIHNKSKSEDEFVTHRDLLEALKERDLMNFQRLMQKHLEIYSDFIDS